MAVFVAAAATPEILREAVAELRESGDWRARRALQELLPAKYAARLSEDCETVQADVEDGQEMTQLADTMAECGLEAQDFWIGGEQALVYLARDRLEHCALLSLLSGAFGQGEALQRQLCAGDVDNFTALHFAANMGMTALAAELLRQNADVGATTRDVRQLLEPGGRTPLHFAASSGQREIALALLEAKADPAHEDWQGVTPFMMACRRGHFGLSKSLMGTDALEIPSEQELNGLEVIEGMGCRERARQSLSIEDRHELQEPFIIESLWTHAECAAFLSDAVQIAELRGWQSKRHRHHPTVDIPASDIPSASYSRLRRSLDDNVLPEMQRRYATKPLRIKEAFFVKYEAPSGDHGETSGGEALRQAGLSLHRDGTLLNCVIVLNSNDDFQGGGTVFAPPLDKTYTPPQGDCLCSCGQLLHGANAVTHGLRFVLIAFIEELLEAEDYEDDDD
eukprot:TRINITY_DN42956_c0_g1_i1.p1 TRINITY_DN42956_c0_g1~~TRINITY_DN42956_c0_g1_i1.p1  ORF type:complete len:460 (-),score=102.57 TRINITY_DN42956_c0_g1_i1:55-1410(-)